MIARQRKGVQEENDEVGKEEEAVDDERDNEEDKGGSGPGVNELSIFVLVNEPIR